MPTAPLSHFLGIAAGIRQSRKDLTKSLETANGRASLAYIDATNSFAFSILFAFEVLPVSAQQVRVSGTVAAVDPAARTMVMKMDAGPELTVRLSRANVLQAGQRVTVS